MMKVFRPADEHSRIRNCKNESSLTLGNILGTGSENSHTAGRSATSSLPQNDDFTIPAWD